MFGCRFLLTTGLLATSAFSAPVEQKQPRSLLSDKRGLAYNEGDLLSSLLSNFGFSWSYNWDASPTGLDGGPEYVPMLWGPKKFDQWEDSVESALSGGSTHILGFNEPDQAGQADMSPEEAAKAWKEYMNPYADRAKLGSPGVTNGGEDHKGLDWLESFFDACGGDCKVNFLAVHWYSSASYTEDFKQHISEAVDLANSQGLDGVWVTEFRGDGDEITQAKFLSEVLPWLDDKDGVERYSYYMADKMVSGGGLTATGKAYCA